VGSEEKRSSGDGAGREVETREGRALRILLVEDSSADAEVVLRALAQSGLEVEAERVQTEKDLVAALDRDFDVVLSDHRLRQLTAARALALHKARAGEVPFLVVSGSMREAEAIQLLRSGARDYFIKDNLLRLGAAIERELEEADNRRSRRRAEEEREVARKALASNEVFLRLVIDQDPNLIFVKERSGTFVLANRAMADVYGTTVEELEGKTDADFNLNAEEVEAFRQADEAVIDSARETLVPVEVITDASGKRRLLRTVKRPLPDAEGRIDRVLGVAVDVTDLKRVEGELRENEERFRQVVEASPHGVLVIDAEGKIVLSNQRSEQIFGYSRQELVGQLIHRLVPVSIHDRHAEDASAFLRDLESRRMGAGGEVHGCRRDGTLFPAEIGLSHFESAAGTRVLVTVVDITDRRGLEMQLQQAQKMEAIGRLAGGLAHDFNNVLGVILGLGELAREDLSANDPVQHRLVEIVAAARKATDLTRQMLAFSRQQVMHPRPLNLNAVVEASRRLLAQMIGADIELRLVLGPELGTVRADPTQLSQVLMNLAVNARDAMPSGGALTFETRNVELDEEYVRTHAAGRPGLYVLLAVTDTGHGMDSKTRARVFEPFFSTKGEGKGTGLGLATVYGIIKQSGGFVWVYSEPEHGATFRIYLPQVGENPLPLEARRSESQAAPAGSETILLVEDQDAVRRMAQELLRRQGYEVLAAANAEEALAIVESRSETIHLVLSDVVMPGTNGRELAIRLREMCPELRVLFMSGYSNGAIQGRGLLDEDVMLVEKPFSAAELGRAVRRALEG
jgi:PAS domain S-box-containing protein